ncbi:MAG: SEC-C metal-binding domain-containing protein [Candidatus Eremiobacteraeota bacterium]|nr:SEC-C metal-binding domain-containing protein [Candidatus Eremiobacteraeota bacterium]
MIDEDRLPDFVTFFSSPGRFDFSPIYCRNAECARSHVFLRFRELNSRRRPLRGGLTLTIDLDLATGREKKPPARPDPLQRMAEEFLNRMPQWMLEKLRALGKERSDIAKRIESHVIDAGDLERGALIAYNDIASEKKSVISGGEACFRRIIINGEEFVIEDLYCSKPSCRCREAYLSFMKLSEYRKGELELRELFSATVPFRGRPAVNRLFDFDVGKAEAILDLFLKERPGVRKILRERYDIVKAVAERSLKAHRSVKPPPTPPPSASALMSPLGAIAPPFFPAPQASAVKTGRNEPCPCGSGRKYKKCCGR